MKTQDILNEREKTHGDFDRVANLYNALKMEVSWSLDEGAGERKITYKHILPIDMILLKLARIVCGNPNHADHWDDIAGYAMLGKGKRIGCGRCGKYRRDKLSRCECMEGERVIRQEDMPQTTHVGEKFLFEEGRFGPVDEKQWSRDCGHSPVMRTYSKASEVEKGVRTTCFFWICNDCGHLYIHDIKQNNVDISKMETTE